MKNLWSFCLVAMLGTAVFFVAGSAQAALIAYFPFDNDTDEVANNLPVTVNGGGLTYVTDAPHGQGAHFDGVDDYLDVSDGPGDVLEVLDGPTPTLEGTIMLWVRTTDTSPSNGSTAPTFVERRTDGSPLRELYRLNLGADEVLVNLIYDPSSGGKYCITNTVINDGQWHHLAISVKRFSATETKMYGYVDGVVEKAIPIVETLDFTDCEDLHIGGRETNGGTPDPISFIEADMDELAVFDHWMDEAEIQEIMANGVPFEIIIPGDTNDDKIVNEADANMVASHWGQTIAGGASVGDFNNDGVVDGADASIMAANWGDHNEAAGEGIVPEPSTFVLLLSLPLLFLLRRQGQ